MKKVFIISSILLAVVLLFLGIYNFAFKKDSSTQNQQSAKPTSQAENDSAKSTALQSKTEKIKTISDRGVIGAVFDKKNDAILYYSATTGTTWRVNADGTGRQQTSEVAVKSLKKALWSPDRSKVITTLEKDGNMVFYQYDHVLQKGMQLKNGLDTAVWDSLGTKIFYKYYDSSSKTRTLNIANPDGTGWQKIADVNYRNLSIAQVPFTSIVSFWNYPEASQESKFQTVGVTGGETKVLLSGRYGADYLWAPNGIQALVSSLAASNSKSVSLGLISQNGEYVDLNIPTLVSKCVWSADSKTLYCALPGGIPEGSVMPDDYMGGKFTTEDTFWKIDTATGKKDRIIEPSEIGGKYDSSEMFLSPTEDALYFINKIDQKLYMIGI